jgi:hypothetical protein
MAGPSRRIDPNTIRLSDWPQLDERVLTSEAQTTFGQRRDAIEAYASGSSLLQVYETWGIHRSTLKRLVRRALSAHPDGRPWGYRALVPHVHVQPYERIKAPHALVHGKAGNAGAFSQLLQRHGSLAQQLREELVAGKVVLQPGEKGRLVGLKAVAHRFQQSCRELGLGAGDYPLNQKQMGFRSLASTLRGWLEEDFDLAARAAGQRIKPASALRRLPERGSADAFDTVEFDAHKMDVRLKVIDNDPLGGEQSYEIERVWLLAIIDVATRCVLGYSMSLQLRAREKRWTSGRALKLLESADRGVSIRLGEKVDTTSVARPSSSTSLLYRISRSSATARAGHYRHAARPVPYAG